MKEQEYINVSDLTRIRSMIIVGRNIIPENNKVIDKNDFAEIMDRLYTWEQKLSSKIEIK